MARAMVRRGRAGARSTSEGGVHGEIPARARAVPGTWYRSRYRPLQPPVQYNGSTTHTSDRNRNRNSIHRVHEPSITTGFHQTIPSQVIAQEAPCVVRCVHPRLCPLPAPNLISRKPAYYTYAASLTGLRKGLTCATWRRT